MHLLCKHGSIINRHLLLLLLFLINLKGFAQFHDAGQDPASLKWKQIKTDNFQIIFPQDFEKEAKYLASTLEYLYIPVSKSLNHKPKKISVLLHNHSSLSNGMVAWAPKIMNLYPTPPQDLYPLNWLDQLAIHELRHVVQIDKLNQGITKIASLLFGEQAVGSVSGFLPRWFYEGDAVNSETALTSTGRGRTASFEMEMKALVSERDSLFSYEKALRGSYRDYVPDPYQLGYPIVAWTRKTYGESVFDYSLNYVGKNPFTLFPLPISLKKKTGLPTRKLYKATYKDLKKHWMQQTAAANKENYQVWNNIQKRAYTNYQFPQYINDSLLLVVKSGIDQLREFVILAKNGKETRIYTPGYYSMDKFSYAAGKFCWAEEIPDVRWSNRSYYCIKTGDLKTGRVKMLTRKTRYFAPTLSPDGTKIAAVEITTQNSYYLVILDTETGKVLDRIESPQNKFIQLPEWLKDGKSIVMITTDKKGKSLEILNLDNKLWKPLVARTFRNLNHPTDAGKFILFVSDYNGVDNLYAVSKNDTTIWQVTDAKFGVTQPYFSAKNNKVFFGLYSSRGFDIVSITSEPKTWKELPNVANNSAKLYSASAMQEKFNFQDSVLPQKDFAVKNYSKLGHLINIHSWAPFYYNYNDIGVDNTVSPGLSLVSQDKLGTCLSTFGYAYRDGSSYLHADVSYKGFYPIIDFSVSYGGKTPVTTPSNVPVPAITDKKLNLLTRIYIPLNLTRSVFIKGITPGITWQYQNEWFYNPALSTFTQGVNYISYSLNAYVYKRQSLRDLAPGIGTIINTRYTSAPFESSLLGNIWYVQGRLFLPGILNHHSLQFSAGYQEQVPSAYSYGTSYLRFPRGYTTYNTYKLNTIATTYSFPIFYPDMALGPVFYFKRLRANLFYDFARINYKYIKNKNILWGSEDLSSTGVEFITDFHFLRIIFPIQAGVRMVYFPQTNTYASQFIFNLDLPVY